MPNFPLDAWVSPVVKDIWLNIFPKLQIRDLKNLMFSHSFFYKNPNLKKELDKYTVIQKSHFNDHILFVTRGGIAYAQGLNSNGQLGLNENVLTEPTLIASLESRTIIKALTSLNHSIFLTKDHQIFSCGLNERGQLGLPLKLQKVMLPQLVMLPSQIKIIDIHITGIATFLKDEKNNIYYFGSLVTGFNPHQIKISAELQELECGAELKNEYLKMFTGISTQKLFLLPSHVAISSYQFSPARSSP